jgi:DNA modification methylase
MEIKKLETRTVSIDQLNPAPYNPRKDLKPGDPEWEKLRNSIIEFGYIDPIIWNETTGNIVGGHQRFKILKAEGVKEYEVSVVRIEDSDKEKALNIALNKTGGDWDEEKLGALLSELSEEAQKLTGFEDDELDDYLTQYDPDDADADYSQDPEDFDPEEEAELIINPYVKDGDIWQLGKHRLVCGDSLDPEAVAAATGGEKVNMIFTDPPYNVAVNTGSEEDLKRRNRRTDGKIVQNDSMSDNDFYNFLLAAFSRLEEITKPGGAIYICHADSEGLNFRAAAKDAGWDIKQNLIWVKNAIVMGRQDYHWQHEPILYGWKPGAAHFWNGERDKSTVYNEDIELRDLDRKELMALVRDLLNEEKTTVYRHAKPSRSDEHPTMKPLGLVRFYIKNSSIRKHIVFDGFLGSGSTLIAADQLGRICYGIEKDERYGQVIVERYIRHKESEGADVFVIRDGQRIPYHEAALMYAEEIK